jgi:uncharacterized membrane protein YcaP (DUF421 family)
MAKGGAELAVITVRTIIVFFCIYAAMRLMGKRQLGELEPSELVVAVLITDMAAHPLQDIGIPLLNGLLPIAILLSCELLISWLSLKSSTFRALCFGRPSILMRDGRILLKELRRNRFSLDELCEELRGKGVTDLHTVRCAVLETDGTLNVLLRADCQAVTPAQMGLQAPDGGLPVTIINDGRVEWKNLRKLRKDEDWLLCQLRARGFGSPNEISYMNLDELGNIFLQEKDGI